MAGIGTYLPLAAGIMLSPMPIIAMIVLCVTGRARLGGTLFLLGWILSIVGFMAFAVLFLGEMRQSNPDHVSNFAIFFQFAAAILFFYVAWKNWRSRPHKGEDAPTPHWIEDFSHLSNAKLFGMGIVMDFMNVKNIPIMITAGLAITADTNSSTEALINALIFASIASLSLILPWLASIFGGEMTHRAIERARIWLYRNNNIIMAVLFFYMGITILATAFTNISINLR